MSLNRMGSELGLRQNALEACSAIKQLRTFTIQGRPLPKGSMIGLCPYSRRRKHLIQKCHPIVTADTRSGSGAKLKHWLSTLAIATHTKDTIEYGPCAISAEFVFLHPKAPSSIERARVGDVDKLLRALCDGIQVKAGYGGTLIGDDRQIISLSGVKRFAKPGESEHCVFTLAVLDLD